MHDFNPRNAKNIVLADDEFNVLLKSIPSDDVYVVVDACHSGSVTKGLPSSPLYSQTGLPDFSDTKTWLGAPIVAEKFLVYPGMPLPDATQFRGMKTSKSQDLKTAEKGRWVESDSANFVALTASQDNEKALATSVGSMFTLGMNKAIAERIRKKQAIYPQAVIEQSTAYIHANTNQYNRYTPNLDGNSELFNKVMLSAKPIKRGGFWRSLTHQAKGYEVLNITPKKVDYKLEDIIEFNLHVPTDGYLNLVDIDANGIAFVLFPNSISSDNFIKQRSQPLHINSESLGFVITAQAPFGSSVTYAIFTPEPLNLDQIVKTKFGGNPFTESELTDLIVKMNYWGEQNKKSYLGMAHTTVTN